MTFGTVIALWPDEGEAGPPHDDQRVLAWAAVAPVENSAKVKELIKKVHAYDRRFGILCEQFDVRHNIDTGLSCHNQHRHGIGNTR